MYLLFVSVVAECVELVFIYGSTITEKPVDGAKSSNTLDKWYTNGSKSDSTGFPNATKTRDSTVQASSGSARQIDLGDIDFDSASDEDLVSAVNELEDSFRNENKPSGNTDVSFPGNGYVLSAGSSQSRLNIGGGPIVRRLPGLGVVTGRAKSMTNDNTGSSYVDVCNQRSSSASSSHITSERTCVQKAETQSSESVKRDVRTIDVCDLSDSDDEFNKVLDGRRSNRKVTASDYASKVFGNGIPKRGSVVHVKNFRSVSNPKAKPTSGCKDLFLRDRFKLPTDKRENAVESRPAKRHKGDASSERSSQRGSESDHEPVAGKVNTALSDVIHIEDGETSTSVENGNGPRTVINSNGADGSSRNSRSSASGSNPNASRSGQTGSATTSQSQAGTTPVERVPMGQGDSLAADALVDCPICQLPVEAASINDHLDQCENAGTSSQSDTTPLRRSPAAGQNDTVAAAAAAASQDALVECPVCQLPVAVTFINYHLDQCLA